MDISLYNHLDLPKYLLPKCTKKTNLLSYSCWYTYWIILIDWNSIGINCQICWLSMRIYWYFVRSCRWNSSWWSNRNMYNSSHYNFLTKNNWITEKLLFSYHIYSFSKVSFVYIFNYIRLIQTSLLKCIVFFWETTGIF